MAETSRQRGDGRDDKRWPRRQGNGAMAETTRQWGDGRLAPAMLPRATLYIHCVCVCMYACYLETYLIHWSFASQRHMQSIEGQTLTTIYRSSTCVPDSKHVRCDSSEGYRSSIILNDYRSCQICITSITCLLWSLLPPVFLLGWPTPLASSALASAGNIPIHRRRSIGDLLL
jgi:hypothetical protein